MMTTSLWNVFGFSMVGMGCVNVEEQLPGNHTNVYVLTYRGLEQLFLHT